MIFRWLDSVCQENPGRAIIANLQLKYNHKDVMTEKWF